MAAKKKQLPETTTESVTAEKLPAWVTEYTGPTGLEDLDQKDVLIPRLALCQAMSPQRQKNNPAFIPGLEEGHWFNTVTKEIYGEGPLRIVPLFVFKSRFYFKDMKEGGGIICQSPDGIHCPLNNGGPCTRGEFGADGTKPLCTKFYNYPVMILGNGTETAGPVVLTLKSAGAKVAKNWNSLMKMRSGPAFAGMYSLRAIEDANAAGQSYYVADIANAGIVSDRRLFDRFRKLHDSLRGKQVVTDMSAEAETEAEPGSSRYEDL